MFSGVYGYVMVRNDGKYVAAPGSEHSYTDKLEKARRFDSRDAAEKERCVENERVQSIDTMLTPFTG